MEIYLASLLSLNDKYDSILLFAVLDARRDDYLERSKRQRGESQRSCVFHHSFTLVKLPLAAAVLLRLLEPSCLLFVLHTFILNAFHLDTVCLPMFIEISHFFPSSIFSSLRRFPLLVQDLFGLVEQSTGGCATGIALGCLGESSDGAFGAEVVAASSDNWVVEWLAADKTGKGKLFLLFFLWLGRTVVCKFQIERSLNQGVQGRTTSLDAGIGRCCLIASPANSRHGHATAEPRSKSVGTLSLRRRYQRRTNLQVSPKPQKPVSL